MRFRFEILRVLFFPVIWMLIYLYTSHTSLIFAGDSLSYLNMANSISNMNLPEIPVFMPMYPLIIAIFKHIFSTDILNAVFFVNGAILFFAIAIVNYIVVIKQGINTRTQLIFNLVFFSNVFFLEHLLKIMPEVLFLFSTFFVLYRQYLYINEPEKRNNTYTLLALGFSIVLSLFIKFNGAVHLLTTFAIIIFYSKNKLSLVIKNISIILTIVLMPYFLYILSGAGSDFLVSGAVPIKQYQINDLAQYWEYWNRDLMVAFIHFFGTEAARIWLKSNDLYAVFVFSFNLILLTWFLYTLFKSHKNGDSARLVIYSFILFYLLLILLRGAPVMKSEINTRTIFYVLILVEFDILLLFSRKLSFWRTDRTPWIAVAQILLICLLVVVQNVRFVRSTISYNKNMSFNSDLADPRFDLQKSKLLMRTQFLLKEKKLDFDNIYTNKEKIMGVFTKNFDALNKIPSSSVFNGNRNIVDSGTFYAMKRKLDNEFLKGESIIMVFNGRSIKVKPEENEYLHSVKNYPITIEHFPEGYIAYLPTAKNSLINSNAK